jgi:hypothetical protein
MKTYGNWLATVLVASMTVWTVGCGGEQGKDGAGDGTGGAGDPATTDDGKTDPGKADPAGKPTVKPDKGTDPAKIDVPQTVAAGSAEEAALKAAEAMKAQQPGTLWQMLPASWQDDGNEVVHAFAEKMPSKVWNRGFEVVGKAIGVLREKKEFVLNHSTLQFLPLPVKVTELSDEYDAVLDILDVVAKSDVAHIEKLRTADTGVLIQELGGKVMKTAEAISAKSPGDAYNNEFMRPIRTMRVKTVASTDETATLEITNEQQTFNPQTGQPEWKEVKETGEAVKIEGQWVPKKMADEWAPKIAEAKQWIAELDTDDVVAKEDDVLKALDEVETSLDTLAAASTQEEFEAKVNEEQQRLTEVLAPLMATDRAESSKPDDPQPTTPDDPAKPDAAKPDPTKPDAAKPDAAKPDAAKPDAAKPDAAKPDDEASDN